MGQQATVAEDKLKDTNEVVAPSPGAATTERQAPDTPGHDENGDGLPGGQATADVPGDVLGI